MELWHRHINAFKAVVCNFRNFLEERGKINVANKRSLSAKYQCSVGRGEQELERLISYNCREGWLHQMRPSLEVI